MKKITGARIVIESLIQENVKVIFGYPGGAVLPIYDELFKQNQIRHILVRHEQAAVHAAEGYARSTGKVGAVLVTSGPGATNTVTGLTDAMMDSVPLVCISGQVPTHMIGNDAFQEADIVGITRPCTKHNYLVKDINKLASSIHSAFFIAKNGRPGPVLVDIPKDIQTFKAPYYGKNKTKSYTFYKPKVKPDLEKVKEFVNLLSLAKKPIFYVGGGIINSGTKASSSLKALLDITGFPCTQTLMGLGATPTSDKQFIGMLGMHGTYEANLAMNQSDLMVCVGARFDDRITGKVSGFSPRSKKVHMDIDASSFNKSVNANLLIQGDLSRILDLTLKVINEKKLKFERKKIKKWWEQINKWRSRDCLKYKNSNEIIKPQYALQRLDCLTKSPAC